MLVFANRKRHEMCRRTNCVMPDYELNHNTREIFTYVNAYKIDCELKNKDVDT